MSNQANIPTQSHCSNCGSTDSIDEERNTDCCWKTVCSGQLGTHRFGTQAINQSACCWGVAEIKFANAGIPIPQGSGRIR